jgi:hypothetical protein
VSSLLLQLPTTETERQSEPVLRLSALRRILQSPELWVALSYVALVGITIRHHEPWADEAQAWLLGRDASLSDLWTHLLRLEGSPGLWHTLLHVLQVFHMPYTGLNVVSGLLGLAAAVVLVRYAPFPLPVRALLPFTYFLCFQYSVVARSYALAPLLLFSLAAVYRSRRRRPGSISVLLILLAMVSVHGFLISFVMAVLWVAQDSSRWRTYDSNARRQALVAGLTYLIAVLLIACAVWPDRNASFVVSPNWSLANLIGISRYGFQQSFGEGYRPALLVGLSIPLLLRGPGLLFFFLSSLLLCGFGAVAYSNVWHHGFLTLAWLFAVWLSFRPGVASWSALLALSAFIVMQCSWTWKAVRYDWNQPYSGSKVMAGYLKAKHLDRTGVIGIGYPTVSLQPYFRENLYRNQQSSFWLWSRENTANDDIERLGSLHPDSVLIGYSSEADRKLWSTIALKSGYEPAARFEGSLFWRTDKFQPENFELYRPGRSTRDTILLSKLDLSSPNGEEQLLWGFADAKPENGRIVMGSFEVMLQRPPQAGREVRSEKTPGARLAMSFDISDAPLREKGPIHLTAYVSGRRLPAMSISQAGHYLYLRDVSREDLCWAITPVAFQFARSDFALEDLGRERVALVRSIAFEER